MKTLRKILAGAAFIGTLAGCSNKIQHPSRVQTGCLTGYTTSLDAPELPLRMLDDCLGKVTDIYSAPSGIGGPYSMMISKSINPQTAMRINPAGTVVMTPRMQQLADSILSQERQLAFLEDSVRYWSGIKHDTVNVRRW